MTQEGTAPTAVTLAGERTKLARSRTHMARERTFAAWVRTALSCIGLGFALAKVTEDSELAWLTRAAGLALIFVGLTLHVGAAFETRRWVQRAGVAGLPTWLYLAVTLGIALVAATTAAVILIA